MSTNKIIQALGSAAGSAGGAGLNVEDVFSTYLYEGTSANRNIVNDIDLSTEGGAVWFKGRSSAYNHILYDTERGVKEVLRPNRTDANSQLFGTNGLTAFNTNGFSITGGNGELNYSGQDYASWTFRKAPKFFDVVTYTGDGTAGRTVSHNLGSTPGCIIIKGTSSNYEWSVYHRGMDSTAPEDYFMWLNHTYARFDNTGYWNDTAPTSTQFTLGNNGNVNASGQTYVAYLFAHNDGDGDFGPDADQDIIKCGSWTASQPSTVTLGFEPQWLLVKRTDGVSNWFLVDNMRGADFSAYKNLSPDLSNAEGTQAGETFTFNPDGFTYNGSVVGGGNTCIYIAIRRGPMAVPESATDVFAMDYQGNGTTDPAYVSGFVTDFGIRYYLPGGSSAYPISGSRLTGTNRLTTSSTSAQVSQSSLTWDYMNGWYNPDSNNTDVFTHMWRRAPNYFDVVAYTGDGVNGTSVSHNLAYSPEMIWVKRRDSTADWFVYHTGLTSNYYLNLNSTAAETFGVRINTPTSTTFNVGSNLGVNASGGTYIAYLFASLDGVSKVGSYTGNGTSQTIDCGFSSGARFVLIKGSSFADNWWVFDTERGIVAGDDPRLYLNTTGAEFSFDYIDPYSSGFTVNSFLSSNGQSYIFYAIA